MGSPPIIPFRGKGNLEDLIYLDLGNTFVVFSSREAVKLEARGGWWQSHKVRQEQAGWQWSGHKENGAEGSLFGRAHGEKVL